MIFSLIGALLYRYRGMNHANSFVRQGVRALFALPFAIYAYIHVPMFDPLAVAMVVFGLTFLGVITGHGRGIDLGDTDKGETEKLEHLILWAKPHVPLYWYDMFILSVTGLAITLPAGIATLNPVLALSGLLKGPAYGISKFGHANTEGGELLTGMILWGSLWI